MRKIAKLMSIVLVGAALAAVCAISASAASFKDISAKDEELYNAVQLLNSLGIVKGQSDTTFGASKPVTREQMAAFIYRMMKEGRSLEGGENLSGFSDLGDPTFYGMVTWASQSGIIKGISDTEFNPGGKITLQDAYVMLTRTLGYEKDGALGYPHDYIDIAEQIGLSKNLDEDIEYTDALSRGDVALIIYNAFYADMNETYQEVFVPSFEREGATGQEFIYIEKKETVCHKIYGIEEVVRRVVATPNYGLDITALGNGSEYKVYKPTGGEKIDRVLIETAAIVPNENAQRLSKEESVIEFEDLNLPGEADEYFLRDITMYIKKDGTVMAASAGGKHVAESTVNIQTYAGEDKDKDYYNSGFSNWITDKKKLRTGQVNFGGDRGYFYNKPSSVDNYTISIYPYESDEDFRISFKAGYTWCGDLQPTFIPNTRALRPEFDKMSDSELNGQTPLQAYMNTVERPNHNNLNRLMSVAGDAGDAKYNVSYYDSNSDGIVDYFWMQPYTFGKVVDKSGESNETYAKHTGDSSNRAYFNTVKKMPEIYIRGSKVVGGSAEDGKYVFAYVSGPARYVRVASDEVNNSVKTFTSKVIRATSDNNSTNWENGARVDAWNSGNIIVGHVNADCTGLVGLSGDKTTSDQFASSWRGKLKINDTWELTCVGARVMLFKQIASPADVTKDYAIVQYVNEADGEVVYKAGGIQTDGTLDADNYVYAYINGDFQDVKIAKNNDESASGKQDNDYFIDSGIVNSLSTYTIDGKGYYTFKPFSVSAGDAKASDLADSDDSSLTYTVQVQNISLDKFQNKVYRFVPGVSAAALPSSLTPNGMKYVNITGDTKIVVNYINSDGESDFVIYDANNLPNFDTEDPAMEFTNAVVVLKNNPGNTITENLAFLYCEIGGEIIDDSKVQNDYAIILGNVQIVDEDNKVVNAYKVVDPKTGIVVDMKETSKASSAILANYDLYKLDESGDIKNTSGGRVASLAKGSGDLNKLVSYEADSNLIFVEGNEDALLTDEKTVYVLFDREQNTVTVKDSDMLTVSAEDDVENEYYNEGETEMTVYIVTENKSGSDFKYASLVIVARG